MYARTKKYEKDGKSGLEDRIEKGFEAKLTEGSSKNILSSFFFLDCS